MAIQSVLTTGCSAGGIGFALAEEFQKRGFHVFATARTPSKMQDLEKLPNVTTIALDVTSSSSIASGTEQTGGTLNYLVDNSGSIYVVPTLDLNIEQAKRRRLRRSSSLPKATSLRLQPTSVRLGWVRQQYAYFSFSGILTIVGAYSRSKAAVATIGEALRLEMEPFGVKVVTCMTGLVPTNIFINGPEHKLPVGSLYSPAEK